MRRTLAIALAVGLLFLGGCGRDRAQHRPATAPPPAVTTTTAPAAPAQNGRQGQQGQSQDDADQLLDQVGQQLSQDAQSPEDED